MKTKYSYVALSADILNEGHINIIKTASKYGKVIVGLLTDKAIAAYKKLPYLSFEQRLVVVKNIKFVYPSMGDIQKRLDIINSCEMKGFKIPTIVDPKGSNFDIYQGTDILKPNLQEFYNVVGIVHGDSNIKEKALFLIEKLKIKKGIVLTKGAEGISYIGKNGEYFTAPVSSSREVFDVTGAGDTVLAALAGWFVTSLLIYFVGAKLFPDKNTQSNLGELLRTIGFSYSPGLIRIFGFNQDLLVITFFGSGIWSLIAMIIAVRQALDYQSTWRAVGVVLIVALFQAYVAFKLGIMPSGDF